MESQEEYHMKRPSLFDFTVHSQSNKYKSLSEIDDEEKAIELINEAGKSLGEKDNQHFFKAHNLCGRDVFEETDYDYCIVSRSAEATYRGKQTYKCP